MNLLPVLKALPAIMEVAGQLAGAAKAARIETRPVGEEIANLEKLAEKQALLVQDLATRVEELAQQTQEQQARLDLLNRRSSLVLGISLAAASLALTAAVAVFLNSAGS